MNNLIFKNENYPYTVNLKREVYDEMIYYSGKANPNETGGVLIGYYSADQITASILHITPPPRHSTHQKYSFHRSSTGLKKILDSMWDQGQYYLGEWHYHPNASAEPSNTDLKQMVVISKNKNLKCPEPILIIVGGSSKGWEISASVFTNERCVCLKYIK